MILVRSSSLLVGSLTQIASYLHLSEFVVGFLLMALGTSLPELFVAISSSTSHSGELSLGNVLGSNIADLTIVAGIAAVMAKKIKISSKIQKDDLIFMTFVAFLPLILMFDHYLSRVDGMILLVTYGLYLYTLMKQRSHFSKRLNHTTRRQYLKAVSIFTAGLVLLVLSSQWVVQFSVLTAETLAIPVIVVGLIIVAFGTSIPELVFEVSAANDHHDGMMLGDLLGSVVTNSTLILGVTALIQPLHILDYGLVRPGVLFMWLTLFLFLRFTRDDDGFTRREGMIMISVYALFIYMQFSGGLPQGIAIMVGNT